MIVSAMVCQLIVVGKHSLIPFKVTTASQIWASKLFRGHKQEKKKIQRPNGCVMESVLST